MRCPRSPMHLSHLAEDFVLFASQEFGFFALPDEYSTGSSLMPQKKNPDAWELLRGKTGRITGSAGFAADHAQRLAVELPARLAGRQGAGVRRARSGCRPWCASPAGAVATTRLNEARCAKLPSDAALLATEAAHYLVRRGLPFRQAHEICRADHSRGRAARQSWASLPLAKLKTFSPLFESDLQEALTVKAALESRDVAGGTAPDRVRHALARMPQPLAQWEARS